MKKQDALKDTRVHPDPEDWQRAGASQMPTDIPEDYVDPHVVAEL
jgi:hypothetical protein